jgi:hypothetical protein
VKTPLHDLISDVEMKSSGDEADGIDLSKLTTSSSITAVNFVNCWFVRAVKIVVLMLWTLLMKNTASKEQKEASVDGVAISCLLVHSRSLTADHTQRLSLPATTTR